MRKKKSNLWLGRPKRKRTHFAVQSLPSTNHSPEHLVEENKLVQQLAVVAQHTSVNQRDTLKEICSTQSTENHVAQEYEHAQQLSVGADHNPGNHADSLTAVCQSQPTENQNVEENVRDKTRSIVNLNQTSKSTNSDTRLSNMTDPIHHTDFTGIVSPPRKRTKVNKSSSYVISDVISDDNGSVIFSDGPIGDKQMSDKCGDPPKFQNVENAPFCNDSYDTQKESDANMSTDTCLEKIMEILPFVLNALAVAGRLDLILLQFFELIRNGSFPLENMAFQLWIEVVRWFNCETSTNMRYSETSKRFWGLGYKLFGERFLNFMGGYKNHGDIIKRKCSKGFFLTEDSRINFAVPSKNILNKEESNKPFRERPPGIFIDVISEMSSNLKDKSTCLTFDGKKLKQGLTEHSGDVDLLGFENGPTLQAKRDALANTIHVLNSTLHSLEAFEPLQHVQILDGSRKNELNEILLKLQQKITQDIIVIRNLKSKKLYAKEKLIERGGHTDWKKGKYVYAMSDIIAFLHDIDAYLEEAITTTEEINKVISALNGRHYPKSSHVNLNGHQYYSDIQHQEGPEHHTRFVRQRTSEWADRRKESRVTGSTLYAALGGEGLAQQKRHFDKFVCRVADPEPSAELQSMFDHGTRNEINAIATIVGRILPVLEPDLRFCEEGFVPVEFDGHEHFMIVSPDGSLRKDKTLESTQVAIEIKCPVNRIHTEFPPRYLLQCLGEIEVLNAHYLLFVSWTREETLVFKVERNTHLFASATVVATTLYGETTPKRQTKLTDVQRELKERIIAESKGIKLIARFQSCISVENDIALEETDVRMVHITELLKRACECSTSHFELVRERATEAVVFILADLDRSWEPNQIRSAPIAWFPKGYSLTVQTMRNIAEDVHTKCEENGIHVPCESFDGQWHNLVVRAVDGKPLTVHQLHKDLWRKVEAKSKKDLINELKEMNRNPRWETIEIHDGECSERRKSMVATNDGKPVPKLRAAMGSNTGCSHDTSKAIAPSEVESSQVQGDRDLDPIQEDTKPSNDGEEWMEQQSGVDDEHHTSSEDNNSKDEEEVCHGPQATEPFRPRTALEDSDLESIISMMQTSTNCNRKGKWNAVEITTLRQKLESTKALETLLDVELRILVRYLRHKLRDKSLKESVPKHEKIKKLAMLLDISGEVQPAKLKHVKQSTTVKSLAQMALDSVAKYPKYVLNIVVAETKWEEEFRNWYIPMKEVCVEDEEYQWFYKPEYSERRKQHEVKCVDATHLLTRARRKCCAGGLDGLQNSAWLKVSKSQKTMLTPAMVTEVTDPMSALMARTTFSQSVENEMRENGDNMSADLCQDIRRWWEAEDCPGISSTTRIRMRMALKARLLKRHDFKRFPPGYVTYTWLANTTMGSSGCKY